MELFRGMNLPALPGSSGNSRSTTTGNSSNNSSATDSPNGGTGRGGDRRMFQRSSRSSSCDLPTKRRHPSSSEPTSASTHYPPPPPPIDCELGCELSNCGLNDCELTGCPGSVNSCLMSGCPGSISDCHPPTAPPNNGNGTGSVQPPTIHHQLSFGPSIGPQTVLVGGRRVSRGERCQPTAAMMYDLTANSTANSCSSSAVNLIPITGGSSLVSTHCPLVNGSTTSTGIESLDRLSDGCRADSSTLPTGSRDSRLSNASNSVTALLNTGGGVGSGNNAGGSGIGVGVSGGSASNASTAQRTYRKPSSNRYDDNDEHSYGNQLNAYESHGNSDLEDEEEEDEDCDRNDNTRPRPDNHRSTNFDLNKNQDDFS